MAYTNFFTGTGVETFRVPQALIGDAQDEGILKNLSFPALRLYLAILCQCQLKNRPRVALDTKFIERFAVVNEKKINQYRSELEDQFLIRFHAEEKSYEVLEPGTHGASLDTRASESAKDRIGTSLKPEQVRQVFMHFIEELYRKDDANGLVFTCPFHLPYGNGRHKRKHLSVGLENGLWMCHHPQCRHHGPKVAMKVPIKTSWDDEDHEHASFRGGGNVVDFVIAIEKERSNRVIVREQAEEVIKKIIQNRPKRVKSPSTGGRARR